MTSLSNSFGPCTARLSAWCDSVPQRPRAHEVTTWRRGCAHARRDDDSLRSATWVALQDCGLLVDVARPGLFGADAVREQIRGATDRRGHEVSLSSDMARPTGLYGADLGHREFLRPRRHRRR